MKVGSPRKILRFAVTFAAVVKDYCVLSILIRVWQSLSFSFSFPPLFFSNKVLPYFVYAVITVGAVAFKTPNKFAVMVADAPAKKAICTLGSLTSHPFY